MRSWEFVGPSKATSLYRRAITPPPGAATFDEWVGAIVADAAPILRAMARARRYPMAWYISQLGDA